MSKHAIVVDSNNTYNVITTHIAKKIIDSNMPSILGCVEFKDLDGRVFHIQDAQCLKIVLDLKAEGMKVLQHIGILLDNIAAVRCEIYSPAVLQQIRSFVCSYVPFRIRISKTVELIVSDVFDTATNADKAKGLESRNNESLYILISVCFPFLVLVYLCSLIYKLYCKQEQLSCDSWWREANIVQQ